MLNKQTLLPLLLLLFSLFSHSPAAEAQSINPVPPRTPELPKPTPLPPTETPLETQPTAPPTSPELRIPGTITVQKFEFVGNTAFSQARLSRATADFTGKPIAFAQLLQAADRVTQLYIQAGYITSGAYIPSQELQAGVVKIQVVEGSLAEINVNTIKGRLKPSYVRDRIAVATAKPLNINRLQAALQLLQLDPLIDSLNAELTAGTQPGTNSLEVNVYGAKTFSTQLSLNNNRNPSVGSFQRGIEVSEASLLGRGDGLSLAYNNTAGSNAFDISYTLPINPRNGTLRLGYQNSNNDIIEQPLEDFDIEVDERDYELTFRQPVIQRATPEVSQELALSLTAARRESDAQILGVKFPLFLGTNNDGEIRISALRFTQEWLQRNRQEVLAVRSQFSLGIGAFNASINDEEPDSRFFAWRGQLLYLRLLDRATGTPAVAPTLLLRSDVQLAAEPLVFLEQFGLGGQATVRGYRQDVLLTDNGVLASAEARLPVLRVPKWQGVLQVAPFIDFGTAWNADRDAPNPNTLVGTGIGFLWQIGDKFTARLDYGIPLVEIDSSRDRTWQENGVYFQVQYNL
jgi:hemolysin activation/secretion protein